MLAAKGWEISVIDDSFQKSSGYVAEGSQSSRVDKERVCELKRENRMILERVRVSKMKQGEGVFPNAFSLFNRTTYRRSLVANGTLCDLFQVERVPGLYHGLDLFSDLFVRKMQMHNADACQCIAVVMQMQLHLLSAVECNWRIDSCSCFIVLVLTAHQ